MSFLTSLRARGVRWLGVVVADFDLQELIISLECLAGFGEAES